MNMEEWQRRMREEKEKDRRMKNESANMLNTYRREDDEEYRRLKEEKEKERLKKIEAAEILKSHRGGVKEDDLKLAGLRKEDMRKKQEAASYLQSYRGTEPIESKARPQRDDVRYPSPVRINRDEDPFTSIEKGSVSAKAATLTMKGTELSTTATMAPNNRNGETHMLDGFDISNPVPSPEQPELNPENPFVEASSAQMEAPVETDLSPSPPQEPFLLEEAINSTKETVVKIPEQQEVKVAESDKSLSMPEALVKPPDDVPQRVDILFSFGLITPSSEPSLDTYMAATAEIIRNIADKNTSATTAFSLKPSLKPYVKETSWDGR